MDLLVFGHKNPDTDSICSSISLTYLKNQLGHNATACALGDIRKEAQFVLDYFKVDAPKVLNTDETPIKGLNVVLVDHNEYAQSADGIE
ncbi:manganese-dependent inorganic pyrophosphatase, partial [Romboutsia weinsteinii]